MLIQIKCLYLQSAKILLLPPKYEINMLPSNHSCFQYCDSNIGLFSIVPSKVITLNPLCILFGISSFSLLFLVKLSLLIHFASFLVSVLCFFSDGFLSKVIALPTIAIAIVVALSRS